MGVMCCQCHQCKDSDPEPNELLKEVDNLVQQAEDRDELQKLQQFISMPQEAVPSASQPSASHPSTSQQPVKWVKRDSDGNIIYARPRSSRKQRVNPADVDTLGEVHQIIDEPVRQDKDTLIEKLRCLLADAGITTDPPASPSPSSSSSWTHRKQVASEHWSRAREDMTANLLAAERPPCQPCQVCRHTKAVVRCRDCLAQLLCGGCDQAVHNSHPLHNREAMFEGFFKPLSPVVGVTRKDDRYCYVSYGMYENRVSCWTWQDGHCDRNEWKTPTGPTFT
ncbi:uncharacterized protein LOC121718326 [Alosa sapidissima]|uniref:uncharacterized protein LOC121718326 n=1 Tax=Alosa sapidissima TaxID=34773 RepID=UPI001C08100E|nr:uncharacterized protein LOC121718326 [Alosa sapidissima]